MAARKHKLIVKLVGYSTLVLGAEGRQYLCWTNEASEYVHDKRPGVVVLDVNL